MSIASILRPRILVAFAVAMILSASAYGFAAANSVAASNAGDGTGTVSGFDATNIAYTMDATDPSKIASVAFDLSPAGTTTPASATTKIEVQFLDSTPATVGSLYSTCTQGALNSWSCTPSSTKAATAQVVTLRISAHD